MPSAPVNLVTLTPHNLAQRASKGPRYTSYPPANHFRPDFGDLEAREELKRIAPDAAQAGISFYAHIPFCRSLCWYCGCNVQITRDRSRGSRYVETLLAEFALYAEALPGGLLAELILGGGSPNFLSEQDLRRLADGVREIFPARDDALLGIELDPRDTSHEQVIALAEMGFRRLNVGVQDFDEKVQATINRLQSYEATSELIEVARKAGFTSAGVDLVYGLPGQSEDSFAKTVASIVTMAPDRIALFGYAHLPHMLPHQRLVERQPIPDLEARALLLTTAVHLLCEAGYQRVGFDHFALPKDPLALAARERRLERNFQGFSVGRGSTILACGVTGISDTGETYWQNRTDLKEWEREIEAGRLPIARGLRLSQDDMIRRYLIHRLMCDSFVDFAALGERYEIDTASYFAHEFEQLENSDLARMDAEQPILRPTRLGFELIRNLCMIFDPHLRGKPPSGSTTI